MAGGMNVNQVVRTGVQQSGEVYAPNAQGLSTEEAAKQKATLLQNSREDGSNKQVVITADQDTADQEAVFKTGMGEDEKTALVKAAKDAGQAKLEKAGTVADFAAKVGDGLQISDASYVVKGFETLGPLADMDAVQLLDAALVANIDAG